MDKDQHPVRICHIISDSGIGGTQTALSALIRGLPQAEFECIFVSIKALGTMGQELERSGIRVYSLKQPERTGVLFAWRFLSGIWMLTRILHQFKPHIVHTWLFRAHLMGRVCGRLAQGKPIIISSARMHYPKGSWTKHLDKWTANLSTHFTAVSKPVRDMLTCDLDIPTKKITVIPNGIASESWKSVSQNKGRKKKYPTLLCVGRLHPEKGQEDLILALPGILRHYPNAQLFLVGGGPDRERLEKLCAQYKLLSHVTFAGECSNVGGFYEMADVFLLPSKDEGMSNALLEAMACKTPCLASDIPGNREVVQEGITGNLFIRGNPESLLRALNKVLENPEQCGVQVKAAHKRILSDYTLEKTLEETIRLYKRL